MIHTLIQPNTPMTRKPSVLPAQHRRKLLKFAADDRLQATACAKMENFLSLSLSWHADAGSSRRTRHRGAGHGPERQAPPTRRRSAPPEAKRAERRPKIPLLSFPPNQIGFGAPSPSLEFGRSADRRGVARLARLRSRPTARGAASPTRAASAGACGRSTASRRSLDPVCAPPAAPPHSEKARSRSRPRADVSRAADLAGRRFDRGAAQRFCCAKRRRASKMADGALCPGPGGTARRRSRRSRPGQFATEGRGESRPRTLHPGRAPTPPRTGSMGRRLAVDFPATPTGSVGPSRPTRQPGLIASRPFG